MRGAALSVLSATYHVFAALDAIQPKLHRHLVCLCKKRVSNQCIFGTTTNMDNRHLAHPLRRQQNVTGHLLCIVLETPRIHTIHSLHPSYSLIPFDKRSVHRPVSDPRP